MALTIKPIYWLRGMFIVYSALAWADQGARAATAGTAPKLRTSSSHIVNSSSGAVPSDHPETHNLGVMVIVGKRASLASAQEIKRETIEIVDSVVGDDINKLPDANVTEALQRVTGVQVLRDRGEGAGVAIRGLTQTETMLNGREVFTAGAGRTLEFADIPSEMVASINVYKTSSADHIDGGIGGVIDLRTRRPFDYKDYRLIGSVRGIYGDLVRRGEAQYSALASNRWRVAGAGEFGVLVNAVYQKRGWREDQKGTGNPVVRDDIVPSQTVVAPSGTSETTSVGRRDRTAGTAVLQWRPSQALEFYAEGTYAELSTRQDSYQINVGSSPTFVDGSAALFPGGNDVRRITWTDAPVSVLSFARDTVDRTGQVAIGGSWTGERVTLTSDLGYTKSYNNLFFSGLNLGSTVANFTHDLSGSVPGTTVAGTDLLDPANYRFVSVLYRTRPFEGDAVFARLDGEFSIKRGFLDAFKAGARIARRGANDAPGLIFADANVGDIPAAAMPGYITPNPYTDFFPGSTSIGSFLVGDLSTARDALGLRNAFGVGAPSESNPLGTWYIDEETLAAYLMANILAESLPLDGNVGLRVVRTHESVSGNQSVPSSGAVVPVNLGSEYVDYLPSVNLRYQLRNGLYLRAAASKTITRPNFDLLSPSLTLVRNTVNPELNQGGAGNPALAPVRADNLDLALERYFNPTTSVHLTGFLKKVDGFVTTVSNPEIHDGEVYQVSRPQNSDPATIKGLEVGYQQFYDSLPGWLNGLGLQTNYTYVDSETPNNTLGTTLPLQNLSKHSYNLIAMYENGRVSARLAYNWRDKFLSGIANIVGVGALPVYTKGYGWLDASLRFRLSGNVILALEGMNLLGTQRASYYGVETRPQGVWINDRQISAAVAVRL